MPPFQFAAYVPAFVRVPGCARSKCCQLDVASYHFGNSFGTVSALESLAAPRDSNPDMLIPEAAILQFWSFPPLAVAEL